MDVAYIIVFLILSCLGSQAIIHGFAATHDGFGCNDCKRVRENVASRAHTAISCFIGAFFPLYIAVPPKLLTQSPLQES